MVQAIQVLRFHLLELEKVRPQSGSVSVTSDPSLIDPGSILSAVVCRFMSFVTTSAIDTSAA